MIIKNLSRKRTDLPARRLNDSGESLASSSASSEGGERRSPVRARSFSRNRTLGQFGAQTGDDSSRAASHHLRRKRRSLGLLLLGSLAAVSFMSLIVYQLTAEVTISLRGSLDLLSSQNQNAYRQTLDKYFAERPLERFRGLMDAESVSRYLQQNGHNEVGSVTAIDFVSVGKTAITLEAREPVARWIVGDDTQFVDNNGSIFTKNYYNPPRVKIVDKSGISLSDSQTVTSGRFLGFIGKAIGALESRNQKVKEVIIPPDTTRQIQLRVSNGTLIKLATDRPVGTQAEDAVRAISHLNRKGQKLSYIDVRISGRAYYR